MSPRARALAITAAAAAAVVAATIGITVYQTRDETTTVGDLTRLIAADPALTVRVLRAANSAFYTRMQPAATIRLPAPAAS